METIRPRRLAMPPTIEMSFGHSRALNYDTLVELAQEFDTYTVTGSGTKIRHTVTVSGEDVLEEDFGTLLDFCRELKSTKIRVNGKIIGRTKMWQLHLLLIRDRLLISATA
jgi:hypothetical protein